MALKNYRPELDGLRAVAVIPVILFHLGFQWIQGGYVGVDVFFVISGFLISSIILDEHERSAFTFSNFWLRRVRRIFPALVAMLVASTIAACFLMFKPDLFEVGKHGFASALSFANIAMINMGSYWGQTADESLFLHTWSLSVEEQFYFIYPFIVYLLFKLGRRWLFRALSAIAVLSFLAYVLGSLHNPVETFYLLPTRAWELASGCLAAIYKWREKKTLSAPLSSWLSILGLAAILGSCLALHGDADHPGSLIVPVLGAVLIVLFADVGDSPVKKILSLPPVVFIGKISYSLYLWHWPVIVMAKQRLFLDGSILSVIIVALLIACLSLLSYHFVEKTTRHRKHILVPALCALAFSLALSLTLFETLLSYDSSKYARVEWDGQLYNVNPADSWNREIKRRMVGVEVPERAKSLGSAYLTGGIIHQYGGPRPDVVVLGDSHALMWSALIDDICRSQNRTVSFYGADATSPFVSLPLKKTAGNLFFSAEERYQFDQKRLQYLDEWRPKLIILAVRWSIVDNLKETEDLLRFLGKLGSRVLLIEQPPELPFGKRNATQYLAFRGIEPLNKQRQYIQAESTGRYKAGKDLILRLSSLYPFCKIVPVADMFYKPGSGVMVLDGTRVMYIDDNHLSLSGSQYVRLRLSAAISAGIGPSLDDRNLRIPAAFRQGSISPAFINRR